MTLNLMSLARKSKNAFQDYKYHRTHRERATSILRNIEEQREKIPVSVTQACDDYAQDVFGSKNYAPWLYVYSAIAGGFKEGWIPDNFYGSMVVPRIKGAYGKVSSLKPLNAVIFQEAAFPDVMSFANGVYFNPAYEVIPADRVKEQLFSKSDSVVFKLDNSLQGLGIFFFDRSSFNQQEVEKLGNGLFQSYISQHQMFDDFAKGSVATLRMTTTISDSGETSLRACYLRLGRGSDTHVQSKSHVRVPVNLETGKLNAKGFDTKWQTLDAHPTSGIGFADLTVPVFDNCVAMVTRLHKKVPYARCVGWDVVVDASNQVKIMEWNGEHNDIKFSEATQGPCFADMHWERFKA